MRSQRTRGKRRWTWSSLMRLQPTTPTCLRTETTPSSALRWTRPCPVPLVRWGNPRARFVFLLRWRRREIQWMSVIYDERMVSDCSIMSLWPASTNSLSYSASCAFKFCCLSHLSFVILSPLLISVLFFGYWLFSFHLFLSFHLSFCLSGFFFTSLISLFFFSVSIQSFSSSSSRPPRFPSLFPPPFTVPLWFPSTVPARFLCFPVVLTPSLCVCLCVLLYTARSPWAASSSPALCRRMLMRTRAAATCWSSWMTRFRLRRSLVPPIPPLLCPDQSLTTWTVRYQMTFSRPLPFVFDYLFIYCLFVQGQIYSMNWCHTTENL